MKGDALTTDAFLCVYGVLAVEESIKRVDSFVNLPRTDLHAQVTDMEFSRAERIE